jgi:hypothetical protein
MLFDAANMCTDVAFILVLATLGIVGAAVALVASVLVAGPLTFGTLCSLVFGKLASVMAIVCCERPRFLNASMFACNG